MSDRDEQLAQACLLGAAGDEDGMRRALAAIGGADALTALGKSLLTHAPLHHYDGIKAIVDAANQGGAEAVYLCGAMSALGAGLPQSWSAALDCLAASAERDWRPAQDELRLLSGSTGDAWRSLRDQVDIDALSRPAVPRVLHTSPRIQIAEKFLAPELCDWLIARAKPKMARAQTFVHAADPTRSNSAAEFNFVEMDIVLALIRKRIAALTGLALSGMENTQVLHYAVGQRYMPHYDFLNTSNPATAQSVTGFGQRVATFLVYLNDDFDAAETAFLKLDRRYRGAKGDALMFWNVDEAGQPDQQTLHAGLAPARGEKWLLSQWIRQAPAAARPQRS